MWPCTCSDDSLFCTLTCSFLVPVHKFPTANFQPHCSCGWLESVSRNGTPIMSVARNCLERSMCGPLDPLRCFPDSTLSPPLSLYNHRYASLRRRNLHRCSDGPSSRAAGRLQGVRYERFQGRQECGRETGQEMEGRAHPYHLDYLQEGLPIPVDLGAGYDR